jgi:uncharacterized protein (TIGR03437 family)
MRVVNGPWYVLGWILCSSASGQIITSLAGSNPLFPNSIAATSAPMGQTQAVTVDSSGNVFVSDSGNHMVMRITPSGSLTVVAGNGSPGFSGDGGPATHASLHLPTGLAVDPSGNLYIADEFNNRIRKVGTDGTISTIAGNGTDIFSGDGGPAVNAGLSSPYSVAMDKAGSLYIADAQHNRIRKIASDGTISTVAGSGGQGFSGDGGSAINAQLNTPSCVIVDAAGNMLISDTNNNRIRRVSTSGVITTVAGNGTAAYSGDGGPAVSASLNTPHGIATDSAGNIYIADVINNRVRAVAPNGTISTIAGTGIGDFSGDGGPANKAALDYPYYAAVDSGGVIYIADTNNGRVRSIATSGIISTLAGNGGPFSGDGGAGIGALLNYPSSVALDAAGNIYVADTWNNRVRKLTRAGTITTVAGSGNLGAAGDGGPATAANINHPYGIAVDSAGNLYIADTNNNRIREVTIDGVIHTIAGNGTRGYSGDSGAATAATLANPRGVQVDGAGNVYIADSFNHVIREVNKKTGVITTIAGTGLSGFAGDGGPATSALLNTPLGVSVDAAGNVYIVDTLNSRLRRLTPDGKINTIAGNGNLGFSGDGVAATSTSLYYPTSMALDSAGFVYIADSFNCRIRKLAANGVISTTVGTGDASFYGDGGIATSAALNYPDGLAIDGAGNMYIADTANSRIREVLAPGTVISYGVSPANLTFSPSAGGAPSSQSVNLSSAIAGLAFAASSNMPWLTVNPSNGSIPAVLAVTVDPTALTQGSHQGIITITVPNATPTTSTVIVSVNVSAGLPATLGVSTQNVSFATTQGSAASTQQIGISNTGGGSLSFSASAATTSGAWLSVAAAGNTATPSSPSSLTITATPGSFAPGTYSGTVTITGAGATMIVPVTLSVSAPAPVISLSQVGLSFTASPSARVPLPQTFGILNTGQGSMSWSATSATLSGGNWLQISPSSGTVQTPYLDVSLVAVSMNTSGLPAGTYYGKIQVSATANNTPQLVTVILTVQPAGSSVGPQLYPTGLIFTGVAGVTPGSQDVQVGSTTGQTSNFETGQIGAGFSFLPTNGSIQPNQPTTVRVYPDFSNLTPGSITRGTITLQFSDGSPAQTVNVLFVVAPAGATANRVGEQDARWYHIDLTGAASGCASPNLQVQYRSPALNFAAVTGQATPLEVQVTDGCGNLVGPGGGPAATVTANFNNGEPAQAMTHIGMGMWQVAWKPVKPGPVTVSVLALLPAQGGTGVVGGSAALSGTISAPSSSTTPLVTAAGVVHAASDQGGVPIAPGGLITVYGMNLADGTAQDSGLPLPQTLSGTEVLLGIQPLPILYTNTGQLNVQVPYGVPINTQYQLTVQHGNTLSLPQSLVVAPAQPGIFTVNQQGTGQGSIVKSDGVTLVEPGTPATAGDTIVIYCTGLGAVTPPVMEGSPAPSTPPLSTTVNPVTVTIGGQQAAVAFSGLAPGFAGLYQINVVVPSGITPGNAVPVVLTVAGQTSPPVTIAIQ